MSDARARLFVALELPDPVREALTRWYARLPESERQALRPVSRDALHVTLCFLGWQPEAAIEAIAAVCRVVAAEPAPELRLGEAIWLPRRRPRVLAIELEDGARGEVVRGGRGGEVARVQARLSQALAAGGWYEPETRPFLAHITMARVRTGARVSGGDTPRPPGLGFQATRVVLYRSRVRPGGAGYEALAGVELAGAPGQVSTP